MLVGLFRQIQLPLKQDSGCCFVLTGICFFSDAQLHWCLECLFAAIGKPSCSKARPLAVVFSFVCICHSGRAYALLTRAGLWPSVPECQAVLFWRTACKACCKQCSCCYILPCWQHAGSMKQRVLAYRSEVAWPSIGAFAEHEKEIMRMHCHAARAFVSQQAGQLVRQSKHIQRVELAQYLVLRRLSML